MPPLPATSSTPRDGHVGLEPRVARIGGGQRSGEVQSEVRLVGRRVVVESTAYGGLARPRQLIAKSVRRASR